MYQTQDIWYLKYSCNLVYFFWPSKLAFIASPNFPCVPIFLRCARHFGLMTCNGCSVLFFFFFFGGGGGFLGLYREKYHIAKRLCAVIGPKPSRIPSFAFLASQMTTVNDVRFGTFRGPFLP